MLHLLKEPDLEHTSEGLKENNKAQHLEGIEPTTSRVLLRRHVLYHCATTAAQRAIRLDEGIILTPTGAT